MPTLLAIVFSVAAVMAFSREQYFLGGALMSFAAIALAALVRNANDDDE